MLVRNSIAMQLLSKEILRVHSFGFQLSINVADQMMNDAVINVYISDGLIMARVFILPAK